MAPLVLRSRNFVRTKRSRKLALLLYKATTGGAGSACLQRTEDWRMLTFFRTMEVALGRAGLKFEGDDERCTVCMICFSLF